MLRNLNGHYLSFVKAECMQLLSSGSVENHQFYCNDTSCFPMSWTIQTESRLKRLNNSPIKTRLKPVAIGCLLFVASVEEFRWYVACLVPPWRVVPRYLSIDNHSTSCTWSSYWTVDSAKRTQLGSQRNWTWQRWIAWHKLHHQHRRQAKRKPQGRW